MLKIFLNKKPTRLFHKSLIILATCFVFSSCFTYDDIEFKEVNSTNIRQLNKEKTSLVLNVKLSNPNNYKIKVVKSDLDLFIGGTSAGKAVLTEKIILKKKSEEDYDIIIEINPKELTKALLNNGLSLLFQKTAQVKVKGWIKGRVFMFGKKVDVEFKHNVDVGNLKLN